MGNLFVIHKDILRKIFRENLIELLDRTDRFMLLWAGGFKGQLREVLINDCSKKGQLDILKWLRKIIAHGIIAKYQIEYQIVCTPLKTGILKYWNGSKKMATAGIVQLLNGLLAVISSKLCSSY